jgi:ketosteroid isomerase-like protein
MKQTKWFLVVARVLTLAVFGLLVGNANGYAQEFEVNEVKAVINALHAAISALDMSKMEPLWAQNNYVMSKQPPDKSISIGRDAVNKDWEADFQPLSELNVTQAEGPHIHVNGNVAWQMGIAKAVGKLKTGAAVNALVAETDVFEKPGGKWLLVSHTASRLPQ